MRRCRRLIARLRHVQQRRGVLRAAIDLDQAFEKWEETCVPSYCHSNPAAAYVSWLRLFKAVDLVRETAPDMCRALDFGASVGEHGHLLDSGVTYEFIEQDDAAASFLSNQIPSAVRRTLEDAPKESYDAVFAIDALEHNDNFAELVGELSRLLKPGGVFIISGPTENSLYRLGRRIAGFQGDYHVTTIYKIEAAAEQHMERVGLSTVPFGAPLFRVSAWRRS